MSKTFEQRILAMNEMYNLPVKFVPTLQHNAITKVRIFMDILSEEIDEGDTIIGGLALNSTDEIGALVMLADWLGDIVVYCRSEALKYGIPLEEVLSIIMDSNESKLDADGMPIYNEQGKFMKGPNYWKPEPKIRELLIAKMKQSPLSEMERIINND
jgi:hypothetical protein